MYDHIRMDGIKNSLLRERLGVTPTSSKMSEIILRWFGHVQRNTTNATIRRAKKKSQLIEKEIMVGLIKCGKSKRGITLPSCTSVKTWLEIKVDENVEFLF